MRRGPALIFALAALLVPSSAQAASPIAKALAAQMARAGAGASAQISDGATGKVLYASRAGTRRIPASVEKLWTTSTALDRLGAGHTFDTRVLVRGSLDPEGVLHGNLYLKGGGDPTLGPYGMSAIAGLIAARGVRRVTGRVVGDESMFDSRRGVPSSGWGWSPDVEPLSALTYRRNVSGGRYVTNPPAFAALGLANALHARGVQTGSSAAGATPSGVRELARLRSIPLSTLIQRTNQPSDNFYAETLDKDLGALAGTAGTTTAGADVIHAQALAIGAHPTMVDGSGLSRRDRSSPRQVVLLLRAMRGNLVFRRSLALAGRSGTIATRMRGTIAAGRCRAKTGTLRDVSSLAGYCIARSGRLVTFAILMNAISPAFAHTLQDKMAVAMVRYG